MRLFTAFTSCAYALLLSSCAATMTNGDGTSETENKTPTRQIQSVSFITGGPAVPAQQRRDQSLKIDSDLNAKMEVKNGYNTVLSEKSGTIKQGQFDAIAAKLNAANYIYLKPKPNDRPAPGSSKRTLVVTSDLGAHRFTSHGPNGFPEPIAEIFAMKNQLLPQ